MDIPKFEVGERVVLVHWGQQLGNAFGVVDARVFKRGKWRYMVTPLGKDFAVIVPLADFGIEKINNNLARVPKLPEGYQAIPA